MPEPMSDSEFRDYVQQHDLSFVMRAADYSPHMRRSKSQGVAVIQNNGDGEPEELGTLMRGSCGEITDTVNGGVTDGARARVLDALNRWKTGYDTAVELTAIAEGRKPPVYEHRTI